MKVIPGPSAGNAGFSFRVNSETVVKCTHDEPAEVKGTQATKMAKEYINGGFLAVYVKPSAKPKPSAKTDPDTNTK